MSDRSIGHAAGTAGPVALTVESTIVFTGAPTWQALGHQAASHDCETARVSLRRAVLRLRRPTSWKTRVILLVLAADAVVALMGMWVVPAILRWPAGLAALLGAVGVQFTIAVAAVFGPMSLDKRPRTAGICLALGTLFAVAYVGLLAADFAVLPVSLNAGPATIYALFIGVAVIAGVLACWRTTRLREGAVAGCWALVIGTAMWGLGFVPLSYALWGSARWYNFWLQDGAIEDFHRSGGTNLSAFLLQDMYGAMVAHQVLSVAIGVAGGFLGSAIVWAPRTLARGLSHITTTKT